MINNSKISGIHHITAFASSASENVAFYGNVLDPQLVKQTVNFEDPHGFCLELIETQPAHTGINPGSYSVSAANRIVGFPLQPHC